MARGTRVRARGVAAACACAVVLGSVAALTGCETTEAALVPSASDAAGVVVGNPDCLATDVLTDLGLTLDESLARTARPKAPAADVVPTGFTAVGVLECAVGGEMKDGAGTWTAVTATTRDGAPADISAVVDALAGPGSPEGCAAGAAPLALWLLDAMGRGVRVRVPVDGCGAPTAPLRAALDRLTATGVRDQAVERVAAP